ncbi:MAG: hypothetical protein H6838_00245 [Planctomycetes bacterium]|nr:hypothetical protein [Planctomycetota bacterium]
MNPSRTFLTLLSLSLLLLPLRGQEGEDKQGDETKIKKLSEWPTLSATDKDRVFALATQFKKDDPKLHDAARQQLIAMGAGAVPFLFQRVSDRAENENKQLFEVFDALIESKHGALLAREVKKPVVELRRYLSQRMARFADPELLPTLTPLRKDKDEITAFHAALGCLALGDGDALGQVMSYSKTHWLEQVDLIAAVLPHARSAENGNLVFAAITKAPAADQMAGLRLARYLAIDDHKVILRTYLDSPDHAVKKEAVNVCRVLHGEPPLEKLDVFQSIKLANEWKAKL